jgi:S-adenosylmethionine decarboxylase
LNNPTAQLFPHSNFDDEMKYIDSHAKLQDRLKGSGYVLGPITGDHLFVYVADHSHEQTIGDMERYPSTPSDRTINIMMFDMDPSVANIFFQRTCSTGKEMTAMSGISTLCPGALIDETAFTPCGYSMNAILHNAYYTIHITPEAECSYASFETNACLKNYDATVRNVLNVFKPKRFVLVLFGDEDDISTMKSLPTDTRKIAVPGFGNYRRTSLASRVETELSTHLGCFHLENGSSNNLQSLRERGYSLV